MLISPPFLPTRLENEAEEAWLNRAFEVAAGEGMYPVSSSLCWHGGIHLNAPTATVANQFLPVRAVADGTVVFLRRGEATRSDDPTHVLNYDGGWTSDGCIVIEHNTEIGADAQNNPVAVRFYSVYMHLMNIPTTIQQGRPIYRKDSLGDAGYIRGEPNRMHFEIACDAANLQHLIGRTTGDLPITQDGCSSVVFGELYFHLPSGTPIYAQKPLDNTATAVSYQPPRPTPNAPLPPVQPLTILTPTTLPCIVGMRYACGEGVAANRGDLTVSTYLEDGTRCGAALREAEYEYKLYTRAKEISDAYPATGRPAPSAVLELLRFGRVINTANETLTPNDVPHWREIVIPTADGTGTQRGWVNLNNQALEQVVRKFSDADFPQWAGWRVFDDDLTAGDSRCESTAFKTLLDIDRNGAVTPDERRTRMQDAVVQAKAKCAICAMPSEWNAADIDARWSWLKTVTEENPLALSEEDFAGFSAHVRALCVAVPALHAATYRFHPRTFIEAFRKCGWLSASEAVQVLPRRFVGEHHGTRTLYRSSITLSQARARIGGMALELNQTMRKYLIESRQRQSIFLANAIVESSYMAQFYEGGRGAGTRYGDWYGRGIIQITWEENYLAYFRYRGRNTSNSAQNTAWRDRIETDLYERCDSAGFWWARNTANRHSSSITANQAWTITVCENFDWRRRLCAGGSTTETRLSNPTLDVVGRLVNTGGVNTTVRVNGLVERRDIFTHVQTVLTETVYPDESGNLTRLTPLFFTAQR
ncbi:M23 family metallopeptidase [Uliginosibacterium sp. 31-12]|uniref:M23 family metallopeptidase n=1 Tax=Uliginosibacterium sp. 31-12 TaxID=3062781 RepID=UPI0026E37765|nr:M23 family metallopeptidase [Uliginosibacterium sp. 31-12]MDO6388320.1 M23 family metallopeptidase [Uliginosibacterium sp. 31-12]